MMWHYIFQWMNFFILAALLVYFLRKPVRSFLSNLKNKIGASIDNARRQHEDSQRKYNESKLRFSRLDSDVKNLKQSLIEAGTFGRDAIIKRAKETVTRLQKDTEKFAERESLKMQSSISKEALTLAFNEAQERLKRGIIREEQIRILDEALESFKGNEA